MKLFQFDWCVCSFDQQCTILASTKAKAIEIFQKNIPKVWECNKPTVCNLSSIYKKRIIDNMPVTFQEKVK